MIVCNRTEELSDVISNYKKNGKTIGFVPTMGALHLGHASLVDCSVAENDITVVSIFVNPIQFNNSNDLATYPRTLDIDLELLEKHACDVVFVPSVDDMYPSGTSNLESYDFGSLETVMEGKFRPGHFNGVAVVVKRLFDLVPAHKAYFGLKDFQQLAVIKQLVIKHSLPIQIIPCATIREQDGLAMSSRNTRLNTAQRLEAVTISKALFEAKSMVATTSVADIKSYIVETINASSELEVEYVEVVDDTYLQSVKNWNDADNIVVCVAVFAGAVRLIDNIMLK